MTCFSKGKVGVNMVLFGLFQKQVDESVEQHNDLEIQILKKRILELELEQDSIDVKNAILDFYWRIWS